MDFTFVSFRFIIYLSLHCKYIHLLLLLSFSSVFFFISSLTHNIYLSLNHPPIHQTLTHTHSLEVLNAIFIFIYGSIVYFPFYFHLCRILSLRQQQTNKQTNKQTYTQALCISIFRMNVYFDCCIPNDVLAIFCFPMCICVLCL